MTQKDEHQPAGSSGPIATVPAGPASGQAQADDINVGLVAIIGVFSAALLFVLIVLIQAWFYNWNESERVDKASASVELQQALASQQDKMNRYRLLDPSGKVRAIPIERAMEVELATLRAEQGPAAATQPR